MRSAGEGRSHWSGRPVGRNARVAMERAVGRRKRLPHNASAESWRLHIV